MKRASGSITDGGSPGLLPIVHSDSGDGDVGMEEADEDAVLCGVGEKKRRLSTEQVRALERSFKTENRLEPERKARLARKLGLQLETSWSWKWERHTACQHCGALWIHSS